jgi:hypothetical protein
VAYLPTPDSGGNCCACDRVDPCDDCTAGACCYSDLSCFDGLSEADCVNSAGAFFTGQTCADTPCCPSPLNFSINGSFGTTDQYCCDCVGAPSSPSCSQVGVINGSGSGSGEVLGIYPSGDCVFSFGITIPTSQSADGCGAPGSSGTIDLGFTLQGNPVTGWTVTEHDSGFCIGGLFCDGGGCGANCSCSGSCSTTLIQSSPDGTYSIYGNYNYWTPSDPTSCAGDTLGSGWFSFIVSVSS